jgi:hypothetical protein
MEQYLAENAPSRATLNSNQGMPYAAKRVAAPEQSNWEAMKGFAAVISKDRF